MKIKRFILLLLFSTPLLFSQEIRTDISKSSTDSTAISPDLTATADSSIKLEDIKEELLDGLWWNDMGQMRLKPYMVGLFDGLSLGTSVVLQSFNPNDFCYKVGANATDRYLGRFDTLLIAHIGDALDDFYADPVNLKIRFEDAFNYMVYGFSGHPPEKLEQMMETYRKEAEERMYKREKENQQKAAQQGSEGK